MRLRGISYIARTSKHSTKPVAGKLTTILLSTTAKKIYLALAFLLVLFFVCNDMLIPWYVKGRGVVEVPSVSGLPYDQAEKLLDSIGLSPRKGDVRLDRNLPEGIVIIQNPLSGSIVKHGRRVYLTVSGGEVAVAVPNLKGRTIRDAKFALEREGLKLGAIEYRPSDDLPQSTIIAQDVAPGQQVKRDRYVSVVVSQGRISEKLPVPDLNGKTFTEAQKLLTALGLKLGNVTLVPSPELLPNTIVQQFPLAGEFVDHGQAIDLFVVQGGEKPKESLEN